MTPSTLSKSASTHQKQPPANVATADLAGGGADDWAAAKPTASAENAAMATNRMMKPLGGFRFRLLAIDIRPFEPPRHSTDVTFARVRRVVSIWDRRASEPICVS